MDPNSSISFQVSTAFLFKNINAVFNTVSISHKYQFSPEGITISANKDNHGLKMFLKKDVIDMTYTHIEDQDDSKDDEVPEIKPLEQFTVIVNGSHLKNHLENLKKIDPVKFIIRRNVQTEKYQMILQQETQNSNALSEVNLEFAVCEKFCYESPSLDNYITFTGAVNITNFLHNIKSKSIFKLVFGNKFVASLVKDINQNSMCNCIGTVTEEDQILLEKLNGGKISEKDFGSIDNAIVSSNIGISTLKQISKVYKHGPVIIYKEPGKSILFKTYVSYLGELDYFVSNKK